MSEKKKSSVAKPASELTTDEVMRRVFPAKVRSEAQKEAEQFTGKASCPKRPNSQEVGYPAASIQSPIE